MDQVVIEKRRNNWCENNQIVGSSCSQSCGYCGCQDDDYFTFQPSSSEVVNCAWIVDPSATDKEIADRMSRWCGGARNPSIGPIVNFCSASCGKCHVTNTTSPRPSPSVNDTNPRTTRSPRPSPIVNETNPRTTLSPSEIKVTKKSKSPNREKKSKPPSAMKDKKTKTPSAQKAKASKKPKANKEEASDETNVGPIESNLSASEADVEDAEKRTSATTGTAIGVPVGLAGLVLIISALIVRRRRSRNNYDEFSAFRSNNYEF